MASPNRAGEADAGTAESNIGEECKKDEKDEKDGGSALPGWWFQRILEFSPLFGEDSQFD